MKIRAVACTEFCQGVVKPCGSEERGKVERNERLSRKHLEFKRVRRK